ncbi:hypothetical protein GJ654_08825 [Rhodoblastus acidophilus]|uniref:Uncharacterized protein n=1 Tax=Rhodoblastus acidophilus TaxID=1074 RepID=A0A6N8DMJ6_RHOAC|nr:hypothetical protein [Rhodoblastus acidophilus]MCW2274453.1 hypothetical protein [Rhodoblastus acidophilus]MTV31096.1 hypothetical protein [Rhodoblastus acidophilus]
MTVLALGPALALGAAATFLPVRRARWIGFCVCVAGLFAAPWLAAALPSVSFPLIALSALRLLAPEISLPIGRVTLAALVGAGCLFYALALGLGPYDPYTLGFQARPLVAALAGVGMILVVTGERAALILLSGTLLAYAAGVYANLWDALIDPVLVLLAAVVLATRVWPAARRQKTK